MHRNPWTQNLVHQAAICTCRKQLNQKRDHILSVIITWEDRRPRLSRQTGFQPVSSTATHFDMPSKRIINHADGGYTNAAGEECALQTNDLPKYPIASVG
jgi:hypothetical protein